VDFAPSPAAASAAFRFDIAYARELAGFYVVQAPATVPAPWLLFFNVPLAAEPGLDLVAVECATPDQDDLEPFECRGKRKTAAREPPS
jgi:hypothetical protein